MVRQLYLCFATVLSLVHGAALESRAAAPPEHNINFDDIDTTSGTLGTGINVKSVPIPNPYHNNEIEFSSDWQVFDLSDQVISHLLPPSTQNAAFSASKDVGQVVGTLTAPQGETLNLHSFAFACAMNFAKSPEPVSCDARIDCIANGKNGITNTFTYGGARFFSTFVANLKKVNSCQISVVRASFTGGIQDKTVSFLLDDVKYDIGK